MERDERVKAENRAASLLGKVKLERDVSRQRARDSNSNGGRLTAKRRQSICKQSFKNLQTEIYVTKARKTLLFYRGIQWEKDASFRIDQRQLLDYQFCSCIPCIPAQCRRLPLGMHGIHICWLPLTALEEQLWYSSHYQLHI